MTQNRIARWTSHYLPAVGLFVGFIVLWQLAVSVFGIREYLLPSPYSVWQAMLSDEIPWFSHAWITGVEILGAFVLAGVAGEEDTGKVQTIGARYANSVITLDQAAEAGCHACASPGGGCQFLGTAATSQVVGEALGLSLPHSALAPSGTLTRICAMLYSALACAAARRSSSSASISASVTRMRPCTSRSRTRSVSSWSRTVVRKRT